jgi:hypothetical protein
MTARIGMTVSAAPAAIRKPLYRAADAGRIDRAAAGTGERRPDIERGQRIRLRIEDPAEGDEDAAGGDDQLRSALRAELVDDPALERRQPGLKRDEDAEGELDVGDGPTLRLAHRRDEEGPAILQIGNHHHADDAGGELPPTIGCQLGHFFPSVRRWAIVPAHPRCFCAF